MKRARSNSAKKRVIKSWKEGQPLLERWRKKLTNLRIELKRPRVIDVVPVDFLRDEAPERHGEPAQQFSGRLIFFTKDDLTIRRPSGAILVIDSYEITGLWDGKTRFEPP